MASALAVSGCSYRLLALTSKEDTDLETTGSVRAAAQRAEAAPPAQTDLAYARAAAAEVLTLGGKNAGAGSSVPWENPQTGAGGNITPLATAYREAGQPCRDFLASYVHGGSHDWLQGAACRNARGVWEVRQLKALQPS